MIYYFYGDNSYEATQAIVKLKTQYAGKTGSLLDVQSFDMTEDNLGDLLNSLAVVAMFSSVRMLVVRDLAANKTATEQIKDIIGLVPEETILVLYDHTTDRRSSYFKTLAPLPNAKEFLPLDPMKMREWIAKKVKDLGGTIDGLTTQKLYEKVAHEYKPRDREQMRLCGNDQWQLEQEITKLIGYDTTITIESIESLVSANIEQTIFELTDAVAKGKGFEVTKIYEHLYTHGVSDQQILAMLNWQFRAIVLAKENLGKDADWQREFGMSPFVVSKALQLGDRFDTDGLKKAYELLFETDLAIKTGQKESHLALETLLYQLSQR